MIWVIGVFILVFTGCQQKPQERHYTEMVIEAAEGQNSLAWQTPSDWQEEAGLGMRLASFYFINDPQSIDCSIVSLRGMAGGLEANLRRWMGQIGLDPSEEDFGQLINSSQSLKTQDGQEVKIYDFTSIQKGPSLNKSIIAAMIPMEDATIFVKMTGSIDAIHRNRHNFLELVKSIRHKLNP
ncbi:MAG: hypothetical protein HY209_07730 [Candidatus Omnitrophica bacterium]|nr:hypothetical protein [Candidatus Omnitrophota bacterium]